MGETRRLGQPSQSKVVKFFRKPIFRLGTPLLIAALGLYMLGNRAWDYALWQQSQSWPSTQGQIERVHSPRPAKKGPTGGIGMGGGAKAEQHITMTFSYEVDGARYQNSRFTFAVGGDSIPQKDLNSFRSRRIQKTDAGPKTLDVTGTPKLRDTVVVFYNPKDPQQAILSRGEHFVWRGLTLVIGAFLVLFGIIFFFRRR